ncbi:MAG: penicillin-binding protein activator LpoB [Puniceicoccales bacterium]|jgi:PBP1b-binding outer membrane lipoprotein LpoB|nr:penicillin-binding protein activator LpoB [Puniceicoccales bacterium]
MNKNNSNTLKTTAAIAGAATVLALALAGCSNDESARYVDTKGRETVLNVDQINIQDLHIAAGNLLDALFKADVFKNAPRKPPVLAFSAIVNDTTEVFDVAILLQKIKDSVTRSGKAKISAVVGTQADALAQQSQGGTAAGVRKNNTPDFVLRGKITELAARAGRTRQKTYAFHFDVIDVADGTIAWTGDEEITKQGRKSSVGW